MHINMSLNRDGQNIFNDPSGELGLSKEAYYFMGGIIRHMKGMTLITNPLVNSYKRLVPGYEAPVYIAWSASNRSLAVRVPFAQGAGSRIELRCPDRQPTLIWHLLYVWKQDSRELLRRLNLRRV